MTAYSENSRLAPVRLLSTALLAVAMLAPALVRAEWYRFSDTAMTTQIELEFWAESQAAADSIAEEVLAVFHRINQQMSRYRDDSELSRVNQQAAERPVTVSPSLFRVLRRAREVSELSEGAFDVSFGSVGFLYDYRAGKQPTDDDIAARLPRINHRDIILNEADKTVHYRQPGVLIDLGGIAKGYAVDLGIEKLEAAGVQHARLSAGGDLRLLGDKRGRPWVVGVRDPRSDNRNAAVLPLADTAVSTSGDYERFFIDETGARVHHILSPSTGKPAKGIQSATILGPDTLTTDGLSTAVFVLGTEEGLKLINSLPGIDAIIIDEQRQMHYSAGLQAPEAPN